VPTGPLRRQKPGEPVDRDFALLLERIEREAARLDTRFQIPWIRVRYGWDPIWSFIPIAGDIVAAGYGLRLVAWAHQFGLGPALTARMLLNVAIDLGFGIVPIVGPFIDLFYRSNTRNLALLLAELKRQMARDRTSKAGQ
jgi:hypothetical protein